MFRTQIFDSSKQSLKMAIKGYSSVNEVILERGIIKPKKRPNTGKGQWEVPMRQLCNLLTLVREKVEPKN